MFLNYYYFIDLIFCSFCFNYINFYSIFFISSEFFFVCSDCIFFINKINFIFNFYFKKIHFYYFDDYCNYFYCYNYCKNCSLYFEDFYRYYAHPDYIFCEFEKDFFYYEEINDDSYDSYYYCTNNNCLCCLNYFSDFYNDYNFNAHFFIKKNYYSEFNISYKFYKSENDFFYLTCPEEIYEFLNKFVIGQDNAKKSMSVAIYNHYKKLRLNHDFNISLSKNNILMLGPSGCGKTFLIKTLSKIIDIPIVIIDATTLTETGYVGEDVENILQKLFEESYYDLNYAEIGIVFIDEIDKIAAKNILNNRDISGEGVQQSLLKIIESTFCTVFEINEFDEQIYFDMNTENILFICGGAFPSLQINYLKNNDFLKKLGFFDIDSLIQFGIIPELIGRLTFIIRFDNLNLFFLKKIISNSENSIINYYNNLFIFENVELFIFEDAIDYISKLAFQISLGSRGLKIIIDKILLDIMYKLSNLDNLSVIIIHSNIFEKNVDGPLLKYDI